MVSRRYFSYASIMMYFYIIAALSLETPRLPNSEKQVLMEIAKELGKKDWNFSLNPCDGNENWNTSRSDHTELPQGFLICNCAFRGHVCHVEQLILQRQNLAGVLPRSAAKLPHLKYMDLDRNYLSGNIPREWASTKLQTLILSTNRLSGPVPDFLGNITTLEHLTIETNRFNGGIPAGLGSLIKLETLILSANHLSGKLPVELFRLKNLRVLKLSNNYLTGKMPSFQLYRNLDTLELQSSGFEGPIPSEISNLNLTELRISDLGGGDSEFPDLGNMTGMSRLILRSCNIYGKIPTYFSNFTNLLLLDMSFNKIQGEIPNLEGLRKPQVMCLTGNNLSGPLPQWIKIREPNNQIDLSYNNLEESSLPCSRDTLNLFRSFNGKNATDVGTCLGPCSKDYYSFHINCGGPTIRVGSVVYEEDESLLGPEKFEHTKENWGSSSTGIFWDTQPEKYDYIPRNNTVLHMEDPRLYTTARLSPLTLTYYGRCLANGNYTVTIRFAEIIFRDDQTYQSLGIRKFDIFIQGERHLHDFDIVREAGGVGRAIVRHFGARVSNRTLEIRFQYTRGTSNVPNRGSYGALVSAISVVSDFPPPSHEMKKIVLPIAACLVLFLLLVFAYLVIWRRLDAMRDQEILRLSDLQKREFNYSQLAAITNNFSNENVLGKGGNGTVYKGTLLDGTIVAIKKIENRSRMSDQLFVNEVGLITALRHPNILRLYGCCIGKNELVLVYEYMENNNLGRALYGPEGSRLHLDWPTRKRIITGVARGLAFLHESTLQVVHRDVKPSNILLDKDLNAKVSDFGTAKLLDEAGSSTGARSGSAATGTIGYWAPEYALHGHLSLKADVYSFGVLALEVVVGAENLKYRPTDDFYCLVDYATYVEGRGKLTGLDLMDLVDSRLGSNYARNEAQIIMSLAMLCVSPTPALRPMMSLIVSILEGDTTIEEFKNNPTIYENTRELNELRKNSACFYMAETDENYFDPGALDEIQEIEDASSTGDEIQEIERFKFSI